MSSQTYIYFQTEIGHSVVLSKPTVECCAAGGLEKHSFFIWFEQRVCKDLLKITATRDDSLVCEIQILFFPFVFTKLPSDWYWFPSTAAQSHYLSQFLLDGGSVGVPQHLYSIHTQAYGNNTAANLVPPPPPPISSTSLMSNAQDRDHPIQDRSTVIAEAAVRHVDSSSLSEDDVFYN